MNEELEGLIDDNIVVLEYVTISKIMLPDGNVTIEIEQSGDSAPWDGIGLLQVGLDFLRDEALYQVGLPYYEEEDDY